MPILPVKMPRFALAMQWFRNSYPLTAFGKFEEPGRKFTETLEVTL